MGRDKLILICYSVMILCVISLLVLLLYLPHLSSANRFWDESLDPLLRGLTYLLTLGVILPPLLVAHIKRRGNNLKK
ncbi:MAG TPA: hypothetical protein GXX57_08890 [Firmicutes bacterium]|nr:hypothetical protein [Bacillota bacterium]